MNIPDHWEEHYLDLTGTQMHYYRTGGKKPTIILLHGFSDNGLCWTRVAKNYEENHDIIMPDARGHGKSIAKNEDFSIYILAEDIAELITTLNIQKPIIIGHSMGGQIATMLAAMHPELISKIILSDPAYRLKPNGDKILSFFVKIGFKLLVRVNLNKSEEQIQKRIRRLSPQWHEDEVIPWAIASKEFAKQESFDLIRKMEVPIDWHNIFPQITAPTLFLIPKRGFLKLKNAKPILTEFPENNAKIAFIDHSGHNVRRDNFPAFIKEVSCFIAET